ncbi:MAG: hypothetical protein JSV90_04245 [Methanobacteriota archaeon]|nr:MAG: hypothetical protein JSV90_04245 [Euryarchaeota archaeon]
MTIHRPASAALALCAMMGSLIALAIPAASEGYVTVYTEDFEGEPGPEWYSTDYNSDSGADYWGTTTYREQSGERSAWCAQIGSSSVNYLANSVNHYYDQDMQAALELYVPDMSGFETVQVRFYFWAETGTYNLNDYFEVSAWTGTYWQHLWKQQSVVTGGWDFVAVPLPMNTVWISFTFRSDDAVGLGPYEGVYIDSVDIRGWDSAPPESMLDELDEYYASEVVYMAYTAVDRGGSGVQYVQLFHCVEGAGSYSIYSTPSNPDGQWFPDVDPLIPFDCTYANGTGAYDFYVIAVDLGGNGEVATTIPQTSTVIDVAPPVTTMTVNDQPWDGGWLNATAMIELKPSDEGSGVAETWYSLGSASWAEYDERLQLTEDATLNLSFYSIDRAGNSEAVKTFTMRMDATAPTASLMVADNATRVENPNVSLVWTSADDLSGMDYCLVKVDDRAFEYFSGDSGIAEMPRLEDGGHTATLRAFDNAGNCIETTIGFEVDLGESESGPLGDAMGWIVALIVIVVAALAVVLLIRFHGRSSG